MKLVGNLESQGLRITQRQQNWPKLFFFKIHFQSF